jgi:hypothetical protein
MGYQIGFPDPFRCWGEDSLSEGVEPDRSASGSGEYQFVGCLVVEEGLDGVDDESRDDDGAGLMVLGRTEDQPAAHLGGGFFNPYPPVWPVDASDSQRGRLAQAEARPSEEPHKGGVVTTFIAQLFELLVGEEELTARMNRWALGLLGRVGDDEAIVDRFVEDLGENPPVGVDCGGSQPFFCHPGHPFADTSGGDLLQLSVGERWQDPGP